MVTQNEYNVSKQVSRELYYLFDLLNHNMQKVDELSGVVLSDSWSNSANSDIRRTGTITISPDRESDFKIKAGSKIWLDKYVKVYIGIKDIFTDEIVYTKMGVYLINNPSQIFSSVDNTITLELLDLMAKLTGIRNGSLDGYEYQVKEDSDIRGAIIALLEECGFHNYVIDIKEEDYRKMPYDISVSGNSTYYEILRKLNEVNINYQMYFDLDGVFHYEKIPDGKNEQVMIDDDIWKECYISHQVNTDYESLKNSITVIGETHSIKNFGGTATITNENQYNITLNGMKELSKNLKIGFVAPSKVENPVMKITMKDVGQTTYSAILPIKDKKGNFAQLLDEENVYYVVKYRKSIDYFYIYRINKLKEPYQGDLLANISNGRYYITRSDITATKIEDLPKDLQIKFVTPQAGNVDIKAPKIVINDLPPIDIDSFTNLLDNCEYTIILSKANSEEDYFEFMGEVTPRATVEETNEDSPFYINGSVGKIRIVLTGGEYDNIYTSDLARQRAEWELYTRCRLLDSISINCVPIYWADVNWLIEITFPNEEKPELYIIKNIDTTGGVNGTQTIQAMKYYSFYI